MVNPTKHVAVQIRHQRATLAGLSNGAGGDDHCFPAQVSQTWGRPVQKNMTAAMIMPIAENLSTATSDTSAGRG